MRECWAKVTHSIKIQSKSLEKEPSNTIRDPGLAAQMIRGLKAQIRQAEAQTAR